jgi:hypothetical protein
MKKYSNAEIEANQTAWLKKLESGRVKQADSMLACNLGDGMRYCCLGVGFTVLPNYVRKVDPTKGGSYHSFCMKDGPDDSGQDTHLSFDAMRALGLRSAMGEFDVPSLKKKNRKLYDHIRENWSMGLDTETSSLAVLNDARVPFKVIAQVIRTKPTGLFSNGKAFI